MPVTRRPIRELDELPGIGGFLELTRGVSNEGAKPFDKPVGDRILIDVRVWNVFHKYITTEIFGSGGRGSPIRRRVADDHRFRAVMSLHLGLVEPFLDHLENLEGTSSDWQPYTVAIRYQCGDPEFHPTEQGVFYFAPAVALELVQILNTSIDRKVVHFIIEGSGSSPLERHIDRIQKAAGGFGDAFNA